MSSTATATALPPPRLLDPPTDIPHLLPSLARIHAACITHDAQLATFLPPLDLPRMEAYWARVAAGAGRTPTPEAPAGCEIVLQMGLSADGKEEVAGYAVLVVGWSETGPFRAEVQKLMVAPAWRRRGVAKRVMRCLEDVAWERGRGMLTLDTKVGSEAELVYPRLGYKEMGVIPKYGIDPITGELVDERFFYKDLRET